jgi:hypothetical protein
MGRSPLAPVTITDRNGVVTTRNKKIVSTTASSKPIPAPQKPSSLNEEQVQELLGRFNTRKGTATTRKLESAIRALSEVNYAKMDEFMRAPVKCSSEHHNARMYLANEMLTKPSSVGAGRTDIGWKLDAALTLARGSTMNSVHLLPFANTLAADERFSEAMESLPTATEAKRQQVCDIASGVTAIAKHYSEKITHKTPVNERNPFIRGEATVSGKKILTFDDQSVIDAMLDHPDKAEMITDLYLERGSVDALDSVLSVASTLAEGAL